MRAEISIRDYEQLSAYLDGQLSPKEKARLEQRLREQPALQTALDEMGQTRALLRMAPRRRAPRNFTLTPSMVQARKPQSRSFLNLFPALSFASALAALALVASFLFELMPGTTLNTQMAVPAADQRQAETTTLQGDAEQENTIMSTAPAAQAPKSAEPGIAAAPEAQSGGPIVTWGIPPSTDPYGVFGRGGGPGVGGYGMGGMGGGLGGGGGLPAGQGGASPYPYGMGGGAFDGQIVIPPGSVESLEQPAQPAVDPEQFANVPRIEGNGPILGLPSPDQAGQFAAPVPSPLPPREVSEAPETVGAPAEVAGLPQIRVIQILLGALALITGLAAFFLWRRTR